MEVVFKPFVDLWHWVERVGGFPGQVFFVLLVIMLVIGLLTWIGNKR